MPKDVNQLKRQRTELVQKMRAFLDQVETRSDKKTTDAEETQYKSWETELNNRTSEIEREERIQAAEATSIAPKIADPGPNEIKTIGDFMREVRFNPGNPALMAVEKRDATMGSGTSLGFLVPSKIDTQIRQVTPQEAIFRPRCTVIPAGDQPDAAYEFLALDQSGSKGVYSGITVTWPGEVGTRGDAGDATLRQIKLEPKECSGYCDVSDKLLNNAPAAGALVTQLIRGAITGSEEDKFYTGSGVGCPLGIKGHASVKTVTRNSANSVKWADIKSMFAALKFGGSPVWIANQTCLPQLMSLEDTSGHALWMPNVAVGPGGSLLGIPLLLNDLNPSLGTEGDLCLVDLKYYWIKDGTGLTIFMDPYTQKVNRVTRIYVFFNVDGQPMLTTPLKMRNGTDTVSPFVILK
jgi:HK97 family phage major capsid protein